VRGFLPQRLGNIAIRIELHGKASYSPWCEAGESRGSSAHGIAARIDGVVLTFLRPPMFEFKVIDSPPRLAPEPRAKILDEHLPPGQIIIFEQARPFLICIIARYGGGIIRAPVRNQSSRVS